MDAEDFKDGNGNWVTRFTDKNKVRRFTRAGRLWHNLLSKCKVGGAFQSRQITYKGCSHDFTDFQEFACWCQEQIGYSEGFVLDKDIIFKGNKKYSKDTCFFVPYQINGLLTRRGADRGEYPIGVYLKNRSGRYAATLSKNGKVHHLGYFDSVLEAFNTYKTEKEKFIREMADKYRHRISQKAYECLLNYRVEITD